MIDIRTVRYDNSSAREFSETLKDRVNRYFESTPSGRYATPFAWLKIVGVMTFFWWNWSQLAFEPHSLPVTIGHLFLHALGYMVIAYTIAHDAAHGAISGNKKIDDVIFWLTFNVLGANSYLWKIRHNHAHHFIVNIPGWDPDIEGTKWIRFAPHVKWLPIHRYQHLYSPLLYSLFTMHWIVAKDFQLYFMKSIGNLSNLKHSPWRLVELIALKAFYFGYMIVIPAIFLPYSLGEVVLGFVLFHMAFSYVLTLSFAYSHVGVESTFVFPRKDGTLPHSFFEHQLLTSIDFHPTSRIAGFVYGGFSAHVAHHMFPNVNSIHYVHLARIIKETTREYGMRYSELPLYRMVTSHYAFLKKMGSGPEGGKEHCINPEERAS